MKKKKILLYIYFNYILHGIGIISLSQNQFFLISNFKINFILITKFILLLGFSRFIFMIILERFLKYIKKDKLILLGMLFYIIYFLGMFLNKKIFIIIFLIIFAGFANACLDIGTYSLLIKFFPKYMEIVNILIKIMMQIGSIISPIFIKFLYELKINYKYFFLFFGILFFLNYLFLYNLFFLKKNIKNNYKKSLINYKKINNFKNIKFKLFIFNFYSFCLQANFCLLNQFINIYMKKIFNLNFINSNFFIFYYSFGSLFGILLILYILILKINYLKLILYYSFFYILINFLILIFNFYYMYIYYIFFSGFLIGSGILQLIMILMCKKIYLNKKKLISYFQISGSFSAILIPILIIYFFNIKKIILYLLFLNSILIFILTIFIYKITKKISNKKIYY